MFSDDESTGKTAKIICIEMQNIKTGTEKYRLID